MEVRVNCTWTKPVESGRFSLIETLRIKFDDDESSNGQRIFNELTAKSMLTALVTGQRDLLV